MPYLVPIVDDDPTRGRELGLALERERPEVRSVPFAHATDLRGWLDRSLDECVVIALVDAGPEAGRLAEALTARPALCPLVVASGVENDPPFARLRSLGWKLHTVPLEAQARESLRAASMAIITECIDAASREGAGYQLGLDNATEWARIHQFLQVSGSSRTRFAVALGTAAYETSDERIAAVLSRAQQALSPAKPMTETLIEVGLPRAVSVLLGHSEGKLLARDLERLSSLYEDLLQVRALPPGSDEARRFAVALSLSGVSSLINAGLDAGAALEAARAFFKSPALRRQEADALDRFIGERDTYGIVQALLAPAAPDGSPSRVRTALVLQWAAEALRHGVWHFPVLVPCAEPEIATPGEVAALLYWGAALLQLDVPLEQSWDRFPADEATRIGRIARELVLRMREQQLPLRAALDLFPEVPRSAVAALDGNSNRAQSWHLVLAASQIHLGVFRTGPRRAQDVARWRKVFLRE